MKNYLLVLLLMFSFTILNAQDFLMQEKPFSKEDLLSKSALLNSNRFFMNQSYSMIYSSTTNGNSDMTGAYINHMEYHFESPFILSMDLGMIHKPLQQYNDFKTNLRNNNSVPNEQFVIPNIGLTYKPSDKFQISIQYINNPSAYNNSSMFYSDPFFSSNRNYKTNNTDIDQLVKDTK